MQKPWIIVVIGCLLMAGSVFGYWKFMKHAETELSSMTTVMPVRMLQSGEVIEASMLRTVRIPAARHHEQAATDPASIIGQTVVIPIAADEEVNAWKLTDTRLVPLENERYFTFKTDAAANVNNLVRKGDRVDVWVEFKQPRLMDSGEGAGLSIGAVKIIEGLKVTAVKSADGLEVSEGGSLESIVQGNKTALHSARSKPSGKPELNTYMMNDQVYEAYVLGTLGGTIKLALPDLTSKRNGETKVTADFVRFKAAGIFGPAKTAGANPVSAAQHADGTGTKERPAETRTTQTMEVRR